MGAPITQDDLDIVRDCERALLTGPFAATGSAPGCCSTRTTASSASPAGLGQGSVLDMMEDTSALVQIRAEDLEAVPLGDDVVLVTYDSVTPQGVPTAARCGSVSRALAGALPPGHAVPAA